MPDDRNIPDVRGSEFKPSFCELNLSQAYNLYQASHHQSKVKYLISKCQNLPNINLLNINPVKFNNQKYQILGNILKEIINLI